MPSLASSAAISSNVTPSWSICRCSWLVWVKYNLVKHREYGLGPTKLAVSDRSPFHQRALAGTYFILFLSHTQVSMTRDAWDNCFTQILWPATSSDPLN